MNGSPVHKFIISWINSFGLPVQIKSNEEWSSRNLCNCVRSLKKKRKKKIRTVISQSWFFFSLRTQLHKLGSQLRGSLFIWLHFRSSYMIYFIKLYIYHRLNNFIIFFSCVFIYWFVLLFCSYSSSRDWLIKQSLKYKVLCGYKENRQSSKSEKALG